MLKVLLKSVSVSGPIAVTRHGPAVPLQSSAHGGERSEDLRCRACEGDQIQQELVEILHLAGQRGAWLVSGCRATSSSLALRYGPTTQSGVLQSS